MSGMEVPGGVQGRRVWWPARGGGTKPSKLGSGDRAPEAEQFLLPDNHLYAYVLITRLICVRGGQIYPKMPITGRPQS